MPIYQDRKSYRSAWDNAYHADPPVPLNLDLELASICNLKCPFCFWGDAEFAARMNVPQHDGESKRRFMPKNLALRLINESDEMGIPAVKLNWRGESTLHPDFVEIAYCAHNMHWVHDVLVNTNGNFQPHCVEGLAKCTKVMVSLDSFLPETYFKMRPGGDLEKALANIDRLLARGHNNVWVRRVITEDNRMEEFVRQARKLFGSSIHVSEHCKFERNRGSADFGKIEKDRSWDRVYCGYPSQRIVVSSSGACYPCCIDYDETMPVGDATEQSLQEIWNGSSMRELRMTLRSGNLQPAPSACQNCTSWMAYRAPQRKYVADVEA